MKEKGTFAALKYAIKKSKTDSLSFFLGKSYTIRKVCDAMKIIVGLGNPGDKYKNNRHNTGFKVVDLIGEALHAPINQKKFKSEIALTKIENEPLLLMKPLTFMNLSGEALIQAMQFYKVNAQDILVIYDDIALDVGKVRLREQGSSGGQNGVKNIIAHLKTQTFPRIRVGIGKHPYIPIMDWVLADTAKKDIEQYSQALEIAKEAAIYQCSHTFSNTMNLYNQNAKGKANE